MSSLTYLGVGGVRLGNPNLWLGRWPTKSEHSHIRQEGAWEAGYGSRSVGTGGRMLISHAGD